MSTVQLALSINEHEGNIFFEKVEQLGSTPNEVLRMFVLAFNAADGFKCEVNFKQPFLARSEVEPFESEKEMLDFAQQIAKETMQNADQEEKEHAKR
ncbi:hypothetical protein [uncultured Sutterella sp.]|mgnify:CR=1 FL=1|uniref:hypothetical protein n=1 Tax=uncultured Sutterella sp. TaxID=286133 RepID=UPI00260EAD64|nr:hypothetical protein [uncultured Sutterella sp.]